MNKPLKEQLKRIGGGHLLKEEYAWERKFGDPLPTLDSVQNKHQNKVNEGDNASLWTWVYKGLLAGFKKAGKKGGNQLDDVAHAAAFLVKSEFGSGAKNDFIKTFKKWL